MSATIPSFSNMILSCLPGQQLLTKAIRLTARACRPTRSVIVPSLATGRLFVPERLNRTYGGRLARGQNGKDQVQRCRSRKSQGRAAPVEDKWQSDRVAK